MWPNFHSMRIVDYVYFTLWQLVPPAFISIFDVAVAIVRRTILFFFSLFFIPFVSFLFFYLFAMYKNVRVMYCVCWPKWGALFVLTLSTDIHTLYASRISCQKMFMESVRISVFEPVYAFACEINTFFLWLDVSLFVEALWIQKKKNTPNQQKFAFMQCVRCLCLNVDATFSILVFLFFHIEFDGLWRFPSVDWWYFTL